MAPTSPLALPLLVTHSRSQLTHPPLHSCQSCTMQANAGAGSIPTVGELDVRSIAATMAINVAQASRGIEAAPAGDILATEVVTGTTHETIPAAAVGTIPGAQQGATDW
jgi:hypothetical protein